MTTFLDMVEICLSAALVVPFVICISELAGSTYPVAEATTAEDVVQDKFPGLKL